MRKATKTYPPPHTMSPEELADCRRHLEQQWATRHVDEALLQRAWKTAHQIAAMLYQDFGATRVAVFGSLAERDWFTPWSDIDIAVWGLSDAAYCDALGKTTGFSPEFHVDLVNFEATKGLFRQRIQQQAIGIKKIEAGLYKSPAAALQQPVNPVEQGGIYEMNRRKLVQRIADECVEIESTLAEIATELEGLEEVAPKYKRAFEKVIAYDLAEVYDGIENIFERVAREVDGALPSGAEWHKSLLAQMAERRAGRPPVISHETARLLEELLNFRHKVTHIYGHKLVYDYTKVHVMKIHELFARVCADLDTFAAALATQEEDV